MKVKEALLNVFKLSDSIPGITVNISARTGFTILPSGVTRKRMGSRRGSCTIS